MEEEEEKEEEEDKLVWVQQKFHNYKIWAEVSSSAPYLLHKALLVSLIK